jgi:adhesin transport system outer membrane protein
MSELALAAPAGSPRGTDGAGARQRTIVHALEIPFAAGGSALDARGRKLLDQLAARLNLNDAAYVLEVQGHADATGTDASNFALALHRAESVRRYLLVAAALPAAKVAVVSLGAGRPIADNATAAGRASNRRAVVLVLR